MYKYREVLENDLELKCLQFSSLFFGPSWLELNVLKRENSFD